MEIQTLILIILCIVLMGCIIKYFRSLYGEEHATSQQPNTLSTQSPQSAYASNMAKYLANILPVGISSRLAEISDAIAKEVEIINKNNLINSNNNKNASASSFNSGGTYSAVTQSNGVQNNNQNNNQNNYNNDALPWDDDPELSKEVCDFNIENRPDRLENIVVY